MIFRRSAKSIETGLVFKVYDALIDQHFAKSAVLGEKDFAKTVVSAEKDFAKSAILYTQDYQKDEVVTC